MKANHKMLLVQGCKTNHFVTQDQKIIRDAIRFNVAMICPKCSGGVVCGTAITIVHPCAHLTAEEIVSRI